MTPENPWDIHPDLTADRLVKVADLIRRGRNNAIIWQNRDIGDNNLVLGLRAFLSGAFQIKEYSGLEGYEWLGVLDSSNRFIFKIGAVPIRFYRGLADEPSERTLCRSYPELSQLSLIFPDERKSFSYRFAVETDEDGGVLQIIFVALLGDTPMRQWLISDEKTLMMPVAIIEPASGVPLDPPLVTVPGEEVIEEKEADVSR